MKIVYEGQIFEALPSVWWAPVCPLVSDATAECQIVIVMLMCGICKFFLGRVKFSGLYFAF